MQTQDTSNFQTVMATEAAAASDITAIKNSDHKSRIQDIQFILSSFQVIVICILILNRFGHQTSFLTVHFNQTCILGVKTAANPHIGPFYLLRAPDIPYI